MRALRVAAFALLAASLTFACSDQEPIPTEPTVSLDPVFAAGGQGKGKKVSYALEFNGTTQSTQTGDLDLGSTFTIELWVKPDNAARVNPRQDFVSKWGTGTEASFALWLRERTVRLLPERSPPTRSHTV